MGKLTSISLGIIALTLTGCATTLRGTKQKLDFETDPPGATLKVGDETFTTPTRVELKRKKEHAILISKEGFRPVKFVLRAQWDGASLVSLALPGGSAMFATDTASGADRSFYKIPKIKLEPSSDPTTRPLELTAYRGKLLTPEEYDQEMTQERKLRHEEFFER